MWLMKVGFSVRRTLASFSRTPHIAIVGSGPAGLYVCAGILRRLPTCYIDVFESAALPYGLVRNGIAPDHPETKNCINMFDKMFTENRNRLQLYANVKVGNDIAFSDLCSDYDAVVLAYGALKQRRLNIPGIRTRNVFSGGDFVSWYNGISDVKWPKLDCQDAVVIGNGNVALDCCRIILSSRSERLAQTDIPTPILDHLNESKINKVTIIGRRGLLDVSFTIKELREQIKLPKSSFTVELSDSERNDVNAKLSSLPRPKKRITELLLNNLNLVKPDAKNCCSILFRRTPVEVLADSGGHLKSLVVENSLSGEREILPCGILIYCIGYINVALDGVPKNENGTIKMIDAVRVYSNSKALVYAAGWCAHSPRGVIANTQIDSANVARQLCSDLEEHGVKSENINGSSARLKSASIKYLTWEDWKRVDEEECRLGEMHRKKREKLLNYDTIIGKVP